MRRWFTLAVLVLSAGCPWQYAGEVTVSPRNSYEVWGNPRSPLTVEYALTDWRRGKDVLVDPECKVTAPSGVELPCVLRQQHEEGYVGTQYEVQLTFTPLETGLHQLQVVLTEGSEATSHAFIAHDVSGAGRSIPQPCAEVAQLAGSRMVCDDKVYDGDEVQGRTFGERTAVAGGAVWAINSGELRRFSDLGAGPLRPEPTAALDTRVFELVALLPGANDAVVVGRSRMVQVEHIGIALRERASLAFAEPVDFAMREGDVVLTARTWDALTTVCAHSLSANAQTGCRTLRGRVLGEGSGGLWLLDADLGGGLEHHVRWLPLTLAPEVSARTSAFADLTENGPLPGHGMQALEGGVWPQLVDGKVDFTRLDLRGTPAQYVAPNEAWGLSRTMSSVTVLRAL